MRSEARALALPRGLPVAPHTAVAALVALALHLWIALVLGAAFTAPPAPDVAVEVDLAPLRVKTPPLPRPPPATRPPPLSAPAPLPRLLDPPRPPTKARAVAAAPRAIAAPPLSPAKPLPAPAPIPRTAVPPKRAAPVAEASSLPTAPPSPPAPAPVVRAPAAAPAPDPALRYGAEVRRAIEAAKRYPRWARKAGVGGEAVVTFTLDETGAIAESKVSVSSGNEGLDEAALAAVRRAAPFATPPEGAVRQPFRVTLRFTLDGP